MILWIRFRLQNLKIKFGLNIFYWAITLPCEQRFLYGMAVNKPVIQMTLWILKLIPERNLSLQGKAKKVKTQDSLIPARNLSSAMHY